MTKVKVSPKDEFLLPKAVMEAHGFADGAEVEVSGDGKQIVLKLVDMQARETGKEKLTVNEFLARRPKYHGPPITQEMIDRAILDETARRWHEKNSR